MQCIKIAATTAALVLLCADARAEVISRDQADAILSELRQIRILLERAPAREQQQAPPQAVSQATIPLDNQHVLGKKDAPVTIVEFLDYQCGFCRRFHSEAFAQIRAKYIDSG